jgi:hypothetical protein
MMDIVIWSMIDQVYLFNYHPGLSFQLHAGNDDLRDLHNLFREAPVVGFVRSTTSPGSLLSRPWNEIREQLV